MESENRNVFRFILGVAVACMEDSRPKTEETGPEDACGYVAGVLETAFAGTGVRFGVRPLAYPGKSKFPVVIAMDGLGERLFWFQPYASAAGVSRELEGALSGAEALSGKACEREVPA